MKKILIIILIFLTGCSNNTLMHNNDIYNNTEIINESNKIYPYELSDNEINSFLDEYTGTWETYYIPNSYSENTRFGFIIGNINERLTSIYDLNWLEYYEGKYGEYSTDLDKILECNLTIYGNFNGFCKYNIIKITEIYENCWNLDLEFYDDESGCDYDEVISVNFTKISDKSLNANFVFNTDNYLSSIGMQNESVYNRISKEYFFSVISYYKWLCDNNIEHEYIENFKDDGLINWFFNYGYNVN